MRPFGLVIAGFDPSGGAGVLRDARAIADAGSSCRAVVTCITAQDEHSFDRFEPVDPRLVEAQFASAVRRGPPSAIKVGMMGSTGNCEAVAALVSDLKPRPPVVVDPVMASTTGGALTDDAGLTVLRGLLLPLATLVTPNVPEAEVLSGLRIADASEMEAAARVILDSGAGAVLIKGGHVESDPVVDVFVERGTDPTRIGHRRLKGGIHGSGCLLSSTVAGHLACGRGLHDAVRNGIDSVLEEIRASRSA